MIFFLDGFTKDSKTSIIRLNHPGHGRKNKFLLDKSSNKLCEIQIFENTCRSWLIDQTIRKNGNMYVCTPMDPLFIGKFNKIFKISLLPI